MHFFHHQQDILEITLISVCKTAYFLFQVKFVFEIYVDLHVVGLFIFVVA